MSWFIEAANPDISIWRIYAYLIPACYVTSPVARFDHFESPKKSAPDKMPQSFIVQLAIAHMFEVFEVYLVYFLKYIFLEVFGGLNRIKPLTSDRIMATFELSIRSTAPFHRHGWSSSHETPSVRRPVDRTRQKSRRDGDWWLSFLDFLMMNLAKL